ncbi:tripartite tricarboxylate transporter permease [Arvimicrobium flavum]|uniref:tripartite tricarboxylate transporter permease n=1 Tax=Arvimicrobium flavum TaxID=3393320 RepID=UPI00237B0BCE|nr:tripartite tricarboxylate transporter permease [Mesorhizobium shangrilense]
MIDALLEGLAANLQLTSLTVVLIGTLAGTIIGALPGLSAVSGVALLLPFTFTMEPAQGLIMLASVYMAAEYGGSISAILINTPGTSGAACTVLDGYQLTRQGKARQALYLSLFAGTVGGLIGALVLIFFTPALAEASLLLGPPEIFWIAVAGLALVASLSAGHVVKGLIGVLIGIGITLIGQDFTTGEMRYTFGDYRLAGGIPLVPILLGLFAVSSILALLEQPNRPVAPLPPSPNALREALTAMLGMKRLTAISGVIGTLVGILPGAGASVSAFVAYAQAKRMSKRPEQFGKGSYEGVVAPESANNAVVGGSMVPLLALGIPGSGSAAVMFGALTVHGIIPGPRLFTERADIVNAFSVGLLFSVLAMLILGLLTIRWSSLIVRAPRKAMIPGVLMLSVVGTYGLSNNLLDVYVLLIAGFLGYFFEKLHVAPVTIALGAVLGRIMEGSFQQAVIVGRVESGSTLMYFLSRPISLALMALALFVLVSGVAQALRSRKADEGEVVAAGPDRGPSGRQLNLALGAVIVALGVAVLAGATEFSAQSGLFPRIVGVALAICGAVQLATAFRPGEVSAQEKPFAEVPWVLAVSIAAGCVLVAYATPRLGYYEAAFVFVGLVYWALSTGVASRLHRIGASVAFAAAFVALLYMVFGLVLRIPTPPGLLL